jgi:hypothetical protein
VAERNAASPGTPDDTDSGAPQPVPGQATLAAFHAGQMTPLAASSASNSLVESFGLRPCRRRPWLAVKGANVA